MSTVTLDDIVVLVDADPVKAKQHGENYALHDDKGRRFDICESTPEDLGIGGVGIEMYFVFLKQLIFIFAIMSVIAVPVLVFNYMGGYLNVVEKTSPFEASMIANQRGIPAGTTNREDAQTVIDEHKKYMYTTVAIDLLYCLVYIVLIFVFDIYNKRRVKSSSNLKVGDYSIMVELAQDVEATEEELKTFFEKYGAVHECAIPKYYGSRLRTYMAYIEAEKNVRRELKRPTIDESPEKLDQLKSRCKEILQEIKDTQHEQDPVLHAFIVFESIKSKEACIREYSEVKSKGLRHQPMSLRLRGNPIKVSLAPEPKEINWQNYGLKKSSWKAISLYLVIALLMVVSLIAISIIEYYENRIPTYSRCLEFDAPVDTSNPDNATTEQIICFCGGMEESKVSAC